MAKSTGPRTPGGKGRASRNAAKHWIESGRILPGEQKQAAILRSEFAEYFNPQGAIENELIDDLTMNRLIRRRIDIADTREYSKAALAKARRHAENYERTGIQYWLRLTRKRYWTMPENGERLRPDSCIGALEELKTRIGERGPEPRDAAALRRIYGNQPTVQAVFAMQKLIPVVEKQTDQVGKVGAAEEEDHKKSVLDALETGIEKEKCLQEDEDYLDAIEDASDIQEPPGPALDTLLRYRAANTRELNVLLNSLERIRKLRGNGT
jgi:hypothetical protein